MSTSSRKGVVLKSDLVAALAEDLHGHLKQDIELAVDLVFDAMSSALVRKDRIEIRGFGSFSPLCHGPESFRNPRTGVVTRCRKRTRVLFRPGSSLRSL